MDKIGYIVIIIGLILLGWILLRALPNNNSYEELLEGLTEEGFENYNYPDKAY